MPNVSNDHATARHDTQGSTHFFPLGLGLAAGFFLPDEAGDAFLAPPLAEAGVALPLPPLASCAFLGVGVAAAPPPRLRLLAPPVSCATGTSSSLLSAMAGDLALRPAPAPFLCVLRVKAGGGVYVRFS